MIYKVDFLKSLLMDFDYTVLNDLQIPGPGNITSVSFEASQIDSEGSFCFKDIPYSLSIRNLSVVVFIKQDLHGAGIWPSRKVL